MWTIAKYTRIKFPFPYLIKTDINLVFYLVYIFSRSKIILSFRSTLHIYFGFAIICRKEE